MGSDGRLFCPRPAKSSGADLFEHVQGGDPEVESPPTSGGWVRAIMPIPPSGGRSGRSRQRRRKGRALGGRWRGEIDTRGPAIDSRRSGQTGGRRAEIANQKVRRMMKLRGEWVGIAITSAARSEREETDTNASGRSW